MPEGLFRRQSIDKTVEQYQRQVYGERYVGASLAKINFGQQNMERILQFMKKMKNFLVFVGNPGVGKTYICAAFTEWAFRSFDTRRAQKEKDLLEKLRETIKENHDWEKELKFIIDDELVIYDDLGSQTTSDFVQNATYSFIDQRYSSTLPTIITSNLTRKEIEERFHKRIISRLFASENTIIELFDLPDVRQQGL